MENTLSNWKKKYKEERGMESKEQESSKESSNDSSAASLESSQSWVDQNVKDLWEWWF